MVTAAGKNQLEGDAAGAITGANIEKIGVKCHSKVPIGVVLGVKDAAFSWWFRLRYKVLSLHTSKVYQYSIRRDTRVQHLDRSLLTLVSLTCFDVHNYFSNML